VRLTLVTPNLPEARSGNFITAARYRRILERLGHRVRLTTAYEGEPCDALIALHARRSYPAIRSFAATANGRPLVVVLTGTDLYRDIHSDAQAQQSLDLASRLVVLQRMGVQELPEQHRAKTRVIYQSVSGCCPQGQPPKGHFRVAVIGHLRAEKDPMRTAMAARLLPPESRVRVVHAGSALEEQWREAASQESVANPRYRWLGGVPHWKA
jgi:hypothetical protein